MNYETIIEALQTACPFPQFFEEGEQIPAIGTSYRLKIVHIRADYAGGRWWNTIWPHHDELATLEIRKEIDEVYDALTSPGAFPDLDTLTVFCRNHPEARVNNSSPDEFNFYFLGNLCGYWLRCITRKQDYNLYLHAFSFRDYFNYLDTLRESGQTNMYDAASFLLKEYPALTEDCARNILCNWMRHREQE